MYRTEKETQGLKEALDILIEKKNYFQSELLTASDSEIKFSLRSKLKDLEKDIENFRQKLTNYTDKSLNTVSGLQKDTENLKSEVSKLAQSDVPEVNLKSIYKILNTRLNDENLTTFCMLNFEKIYNGFGDGQTKTAKINRLLDYTKRQNLLEKLNRDLHEFLEDL